MPEQTYTIVGGAAYGSHTPRAVIQALESLRDSQHTARIWYGHTEGPDAGLDWGEENDVQGRIGRSCGQYQVPLMIAPRADGGPVLLEQYIVRIDDVKTRRTLYQHPQFRQETYVVAPSLDEGYVERVLADGQEVAAFKQAGKAQAWIDWMTGKSYRRVV